MAANFERCQREINDAAKGRISDDAALEAATKLHNWWRRSEHHNGRMNDEDLKAGARRFAGEARKQASYEYAARYKMAQAAAHAIDYIKTNFADLPRLGLQAIMVGTNVARRGARRSIESLQHEKGLYWINGVSASLEKADLHRVAVRGDMDEDIYKALYKLYSDDTDMAGIPDEARKIAEIVFKAQEVKRLELNRQGANIAKNPSHVTDQSHDSFKLSHALYQTQGGVVRNLMNRSERANFEAWRDFIMPLLDEVETYKDVPIGEEEKFLWEAWRNLVSGNHLKYDDPYTIQPHQVGGGSLAKRLSAERKLHFKDGSSRYKYDQTFGRGSTLIERVIEGLQHGARDYALMSAFGPNPRYTFDRLKASVQVMSTDSAASRQEAINPSGLLQLDALYHQVDGTAHVPAHDIISTVLRAMRNIQAMSKLGSATLSSFPDLPNAAAQLQYNGITAGDAWKSMFEGFFRDTTKWTAEGKMLASELGVLADGLRAGVTSRFSAQDGVAGTTTKLLRTFFKYNLQTWWTDTLRQTFAMTLSHHVANRAHLPYEQLGEELHRMMTLFDISREDWEFMRGRGVRSVEGRDYFIPSAVHDLHNEVVRAHMEKLGFEISDKKIRDFKDGIESRFRTWFSEQAMQGVLQPGARVQAMISGGYIPTSGSTGFGSGHGGGTLGSLFRAMMQFKSYPFAFVDQTMGRYAYGYSPDAHFNWRRAVGNLPVMFKFAQLMVTTTMMGYMAWAAKRYVQGKELPDHSKYWGKIAAASFVQGGGAGIYGDFLFGEAKSRYGHSALETFLGPTWGTLADVYDFAVAGNRSATKAFFAAKNNTPFINMFYSRIALDYLFLYRWQESLRPGSLRRMHENMKKEQGAGFRIPPHTVIRPDRYRGGALDRFKTAVTPQQRTLDALPQVLTGGSKK